MKKLLQTAILILTTFYATDLYSQNVMINVVTQNSGVVKKDEIVFFEIAINNTSPTKTIPAYKLRPQISFPTTIVDIPPVGHVLPTGWEIISISNGVVSLTNGTDIIPQNERRTILISIRGKVIGGPSTILGNLSFSNGVAPGSASGSSPVGDNNADNVSTSSVRVVK